VTNCPFCGSEHTIVHETRRPKGRDNQDGYRRRRRQCARCYKRFTTYEITMRELKQLKQIRLAAEATFTKSTMNGIKSQADKSKRRDLPRI